MQSAPNASAETGGAEFNLRMSQEQPRLLPPVDPSGPASLLSPEYALASPECPSPLASRAGLLPSTPLS
jgi:hypothetical protein